MGITGLRCVERHETKCEGKTWQTVTAPNFLYYVLAGRFYSNQNENKTYFINVSSVFTICLFDLSDYKRKCLFRNVQYDFKLIVFCHKHLYT